MFFFLVLLFVVWVKNVTFIIGLEKGWMVLMKMLIIPQHRHLSLYGVNQLVLKKRSGKYPEVRAFPHKYILVIH